MSLGSDFASGYGLGLKTREFNNPASILNMTLQAHQPKSGYIKRGSAGSILQEARKEALEIKARELDLKAKELEIKETALNNDMDRRLVAAQTENYASVTKQRESEGLRQSRLDAEKRVTEARGLVIDQEKERKSQMAEKAIRGFYTKDKTAIMEFVNQNGSPNANIKDVRWQEGKDEKTGQETSKVTLYFDNGQKATFDSDKEAINKVILPMAIMLKDVEGRMTDAQRVSAEQKTRGLDIEQQRATAYGKSFENKGLMTDKQKADLRLKAQGQAFNEYKGGELPFDQIDARAEEIHRNSLSSPSGDPTLDMPDPAGNEGKIIKDTETGKRYKSDGKNWNEVK